MADAKAKQLLVIILQSDKVNLLTETLNGQNVKAVFGTISSIPRNSFLPKNVITTIGSLLSMLDLIGEKLLMNK